MPDTVSFSLARRLRAGETVFSGWCNLPSPHGAELIAHEGFVAVVIDMQHGLWDTTTMLQGVSAIRQAGAAAIVRPPLNDFATASRALDFGADAIIAPMINSAADARALVAAAKFPPLGERSWGPHRALMLSGVAQADYLKSGHEMTLTFAMIETRAALDNVDAIVGTPGIDALFVGPSDLSIALSNGAAINHNAPEVLAALDTIAAAAKKAGKIAGAFCADAPRAVELSKKGYRFLTVASDQTFLRAGAAAAFKTVQAG